MNGNSLICWMPALSRYTIADKRLAGTNAVQTFIYQFVVFSKTKRLTLKTSEEKCPLLSR